MSATDLVSATDLEALTAALPDHMRAFLVRGGDRVVICNAQPGGGLHWTMARAKSLDDNPDLLGVEGELLAVYRGGLDPEQPPQMADPEPLEDDEAEDDQPPPPAPDPDPVALTQAEVSAFRAAFADHLKERPKGFGFKLPSLLRPKP